jgi:hypothetical protein
METEVLLSCSQEVATGPCHEPDKFSPQLPTLTRVFLRSILILSSHLRVGISNVLFPTG